MNHTTNFDFKGRRKRCLVYSWGCNESSQLGLGENLNHQYEPVPLEMLKGKKISYVASGAHHNIARSTGGDVFAWGKGNVGQLGLGPENKRGYLPQRVRVKKKKVLMVSCGEGFTASIVSDKLGSVYCWGDNTSGQLGIDSNDPVSWIPNCLTFFAKKSVISIGAGSSHCACVVQNPGGDTEVYTWGSGENGKLGNNSEKSEKTPYLVETLRGARALTVSCGSDFTVVLSARGDVYTWGCGDSGRTGTGSTDSVLIPVCLSAAFSNVEIIELSTGPDHVAAVSSTGKLYTWGYGSNGRLGHGVEADVFVPTQVEALSDEKIVHAACGGHHTAAVTDIGMLYTFGWNHYGQLGHGPVGINDCTMVPMIVEGLKTHCVVQVSCGEQHTIALVQ